MKKMVAIVSFLISMPGIAQGVEFQTPGAMGMGGAGVARNNGSLTSYWNPAAGAFSKSSFALNAGVGVGIRGSDGLAENIDHLSNIDFDNVKNFNTTTAGVNEVGDVVKTLSIFNDINTRKGNIAINVIAPVSISIKNISFGIYGGLAACRANDRATGYQKVLKLPFYVHFRNRNPYQAESTPKKPQLAALYS